MEVITREYVEVVRELVYDDGHGNGYAFPVNEDGSPVGLEPPAIANLEKCKAHPEEFVRQGVIVETRVPCRDAYGICPYCGERVWLQGYDYYGAYSCSCGHWFNASGQELLPPGEWEEDR